MATKKDEPKKDAKKKVPPKRGRPVGAKTDPKKKKRKEAGQLTCFQAANIAKEMYNIATIEGYKEEKFKGDYETLVELSRCVIPRIKPRTHQESIDYEYLEAKVIEMTDVLKRLDELEADKKKREEERRNNNE